MLHRGTTGRRRRRSLPQQAQCFSDSGMMQSVNETRSVCDVLSCGSDGTSPEPFAIPSAELCHPDSGPLSNGMTIDSGCWPTWSRVRCAPSAVRSDGPFIAATAIDSFTAARAVRPYHAARRCDRSARRRSFLEETPVEWPVPDPTSSFHDSRHPR